MRTGLTVHQTWLGISFTSSHLILTTALEGVYNLPQMRKSKSGEGRTLAQGHPAKQSLDSAQSKPRLV